MSSLSHLVSGRMPLPNMPSSVLTMTWLAFSCQLLGLSPYFGWPTVVTGRWTAMLTPVPRIRPKRVDGVAYASESRAALESLTMAESSTCRPFSRQASLMTWPRSSPTRPSAARKPLPMLRSFPPLDDVCLLPLVAGK